MERIESVQNPTIKRLKALKNKKGRQEADGLFLVEGESCVEEALVYGQVECILARRETPLTQEAEHRGVRVILVSDRVLEAVASVKTAQEVLAAARLMKRPFPLSPGLFVAMEDVQDPQNVGAILRTADAAGAAGAILSPDCADVTGPKAVRASMGSVFHLPIWTPEEFLFGLRELQEAGVQIVAGSLHGQQGGPLPKNACILIGNEARGLSKEALELADLRYTIPIYGQAESLNAGVAAGILLYRAKEGC